MGLFDLQLVGRLSEPCRIDRSFQTAAQAKPVRPEVGSASAALVEAIILAGGKAERLGDAAAGRPKALVDIAGRPLAAYQVEQLAAAGVDRVIVSCSAGQEDVFEAALGGIGPEIVAVGEPEPLGRGGGIRFAAASRRETGDVFALNGDELVVVTGFREAPQLEGHWVSCGIYVLGEEALARFPERGDHETTTFPALAGEGRLRAHRHEGLWLTVNTAKDLRLAEEHLAANPGWPVRSG